MNEPRTLPLTRGREAIVDAADYEWLSQWKWYVSNAGYVMRRDGKYGRLVLLHRLITGLDEVSPKVAVPDHINRNPLDNRRANLRVVSNSSNGQNRPATGASGFVGVYKRKSKAGPVWQAMIQCNRRSYSLGQYRTPEQASKAREAAAGVPRRATATTADAVRGRTTAAPSCGATRSTRSVRCWARASDPPRSPRCTA